MALSIQLLNTTHDVKTFDCGRPKLNEWLQTMARQLDSKGKAKTYVLVDDAAPSIIMGYYAINLCEVKGNDLPSDHAKKLPRDVPAYRVGRLATSMDFQKKGFGEALLVDALGRAKAVAIQVGGFAVFVDAKDDEAAAFYLKYGFTALPDQPLTLFIPIKSIP